MYFNHLETVGQVKAEYRTLAKLHHPDRGGDTATMQRVNAEYHAKLESLDGQTSLGFDGKDHTYWYNAEVEQEVMDKISELLALNLANCDIELIGTWVWVSGDTKPVKEQLKAAGCIWHSKRKRWFWRRPTYRRRYSGLSMAQLRNAYGAQTFSPRSDDQPARAALATG